MDFKRSPFIVDDQPAIDEPFLCLGARVYAAADINAHQGEVTDIDGDSVVIDFCDWIARLPRNAVSVQFMRASAMLCLVAEQPGVVLVDYGLCTACPTAA